MGEAHRLGRPLSVPDGIIAAISIVSRSALATRTIADLQAIPELDLVNPWHFR
jgi:predicted nucleic acid-binding protein